MKLKNVIVLLAASGFFFVVVSSLRRKRPPLEIASRDLGNKERLGYKERSVADLASQNLLDLNSSTVDQLRALGLEDEASDRIVENRPYRNKLDLVSRMVIPEQIYNTIKHQVDVAGATEPVKIAG
jgi:hypothetical protein